MARLFDHALSRCLELLLLATLSLHLSDRGDGRDEEKRNECGDEESECDSEGKKKKMMNFTEDDGCSPGYVNCNGVCLPECLCAPLTDEAGDVCGHARVGNRSCPLLRQ